MILDPLLEAQKAAIQILDTDADLKAIVLAITGHPSEGQAMPYIVIGSDSADNSAKTVTRESGSLMLHTWSNYRGTTEARQIQARCRQLLHQQPEALMTANPNLSIEDILHEFSRVDEDKERLIYHGVQTFQLRL